MHWILHSRYFIIFFLYRTSPVTFLWLFFNQNWYLVGPILKALFFLGYCYQKANFGRLSKLPALLLLAPFHLGLPLSAVLLLESLEMISLSLLLLAIRLIGDGHFRSQRRWFWPAMPYLPCTLASITRRIEGIAVNIVINLLVIV